jgi:hypothetical protein
MVTLWVIGGCACTYASAAGSGAAAFDDQVTVAGEAHDTPRVATSGADVPLRAALRRMVPVAYSINLPNAGAWAATPVSWSAGHSLAQTLRDMLTGHPELAAQVDTDFQLVTVRYRQPFGADTVGALMPAAAGTPSAAPSQGVAVGAPLGADVDAARPLESGPVPRMPQPATFGTSPAGLAPRLSSMQFAPANARPVAHPATQADRTTDTSAAPLATAGALATASNGAAAKAPVPGARAALAPSTASLANEPATPPMPLPAPPVPVQTWHIDLSDRTVRGALTRWTQEAGWRLIWEAPVDFAVDAPATLTGTFDDALQSVIGALSATDAPVQAILYRGNKVLRIVEKGAG